MRNRYFITLVIVLTSLTKGLPCICIELDEEGIKESYNDSDYVIIGRAYTNVHFDSDMQKGLNTNEKGISVLIQIDSVLKGNLKKDQKMFIYQNSSSCAKAFHFGESYLIFGDVIRKFKSLEQPKIKNPNIEYPPPAPSGLIDGEYEVISNRKIVRFLNRKVSKYITITTNQCSTMHVNSQLFSETINFLK